MILSSSSGVVGAMSVPSASSRSFTSGDSSGLAHLGVEPGDHHGRRAGGGEERAPEIVGAALEAGLLGGRHGREDGGALGAAGRERHAYAAVTHHRQRRDPGREEVVGTAVRGVTPALPACRDRGMCRTSIPAESLNFSAFMCAGPTPAEA